MTIFQNIQRAAAVLATAGLLVPNCAFAAPRGPVNSTSQARVADIALQAEGTLHGRVVDLNGKPQPGMRVQVAQGEKPVADVTTNADGRFEVAGLHGGVYQVATVAGGDVFRLWAPRTAPPAAQPAVVITSGADLVLGQSDGRFMNFITNPWVLGCVVAAAIAIPLALDDDDDAS